MAKAIDKCLPLNIAAATISVRAAVIIGVWATIVAAVVTAAYYRACRKSADKARTKTASTVAMPMLRLS